MSGALLSDDLHRFRLFHVIVHWGRVTIHAVLKWSFEYQKINETNLYEIVHKNMRKKTFNKDQINILQEGVTINSLDIPLTFLLLLHIGGLSKLDDPAWQTYPSLEYNLKMLKFHRNNLVHSYDSMTEKETNKKINELCKLYENILSNAGSRFLIEEDIVKYKIVEVTKGIGSILKCEINKEERYINNLLKEVFESNNNKTIAATVASRIDVKNCRIKDGYLEALPVLFSFTHPTEIIFETSKDPNTVRHLLQCIKFISERSIISRIILKFEYNYCYSNNGIDNKYIELLTENQTCRLQAFMGSLKLSGFPLLPIWTERLYLRITENQIASLNENLPRLENLSLLAVVLDLYESCPSPESIDCINFRYTDKKLNLQIAAHVTDVEAIYASQIFVKLCPRGIKSLNEIQFKGTSLSGNGISRCLEELHRNNINTQKIIFRTTEIISKEEMISLRLAANSYNMKQIEIKNWSRI